MMRVVDRELAGRWGIIPMLVLALTMAGCTAAPPDNSGETTSVQQQTPPQEPDFDREIRKNVEIEIDAEEVRWSAHLRRLRDDRLRWFNSSSDDLTIRFTDPYPFAGDSGLIRVPAGQHSDWFKVRPGAQGIKQYVTTPTRTGGAPEGPQVSVGD